MEGVRLRVLRFSDREILKSPLTPLFQRGGYTGRPEEPII
jgi:hypothetical protein